MSVETTNNSNATMWATGAGLAGGAIAGTIGYKQNSFIKNNEITDDFVKQVIANADDCKDIESKNFLKGLKQILNAKSIDEISIQNENLLNDNELKQAKKEIMESLKIGFLEYWDSDKKTFKVSDDEKAVGEYLNNIAKGFKRKTALLYGGITAGVLGLGTFLAVNHHNKSSEKAPENKSIQE